MSSFNDQTLEGTVPSDGEIKATTPSVNQGYYGHDLEQQSSYTREGAYAPPPGPPPAAATGSGDYDYGVYGKESADVDGIYNQTSTLSKFGKARSVILDVLSTLFVLFLIIFCFLLIVPTKELIEQWFVIQLDFTRVDFTQLFQVTDNEDIAALAFSDSGIPALIRFGLFGYCTGSLNEFGDFVAEECVKKPLWNLNLNTILAMGIYSSGSTDTRVWEVRYGLHFPDALNSINDWQSKCTAVCYIILLILSFFALGALIWIFVMQSTKERNFKDGTFNFRTSLITIVTLSSVSIILFVIGASAITRYAATTIVRGLKRQRSFGIIATRSVLFFLFSWIGFAISLLVLMATSMSLWFALH